MNVYQFIKHTKSDPLKWITYCEIVINKHGGIIIVNPSHEKTLLEYVAEKENKTVEQIMKEIPEWCSPSDFIVDKYGIIAVWYNRLLVSSIYRINRFQQRTIDILKANNLIYEDCYIEKARDYAVYRYRELLSNRKIPEPYDTIYDIDNNSLYTVPKMIHHDLTKKGE